MPRPRRCRRLGMTPNTTYFKPTGNPMNELNEIIVDADEFEAVRLKDVLGLDQNEAAQKMGVSQPTFHRIVNSARKKLSSAIVNGYAIKIESN